MYKKLNIENSYSVKQKLFKDERGFFTEYLHYPSELPLPNFVTQNISYSIAGTLRGLHLQEYPAEQSKYVTCISGAIYDFFIDLRRQSNTYKQITIIKLNGSELDSVYVPAGCAHGFYAEQDSIVLYGVSEKRVQKLEVCLNPLDIFSNHIKPYLKEKIELIISEKDRNAISIEDYLNNKKYNTHGGLFE